MYVLQADFFSKDEHGFKEENEHIGRPGLDTKHHSFVSCYVHS